MRVTPPLIHGLRGRLMVSVLGALLLVLAALTIGFNLVLRDRLNTEANSIVQARASAELASLRIAGGQIRLPEAPDDRNPEIQIWVFQGDRAIEQPRANSAQNQAASSLAGVGPALRDMPGSKTRLYALPVRQSGRRVGTVVAAVSLAPYVQTRNTALVASAVLAVVVLIAVALAARWLIDRALRPVAQMTRQASEWSERDLDRRFALGPGRDELTQLGHTLDGLLERLAHSLRHEQRLSAEISHELRTPLTSIIAETQFALRHGHQSDETRTTLEHILQGAHQLDRTLNTLMAAARAQLDPHGRSSDAGACVEAAVTASLGLEPSQQLQLRVELPREPVRVAAEQDLVERILAPLLENAARYAQDEIRIEVKSAPAGVTFTVQDDGPGIPDDARDEIFQPGRSGPSSTASTISATGAGLGLALCRRLARSAGGDVRAEATATGACFIVSLPAA